MSRINLQSIYAEYVPVQTKCGVFYFRVLGDPARLLDIPIKFYYGIDVSPKDELRPLYQPVEKPNSAMKVR